MNKILTTICFQLSMPNVGSWNGKWTGSENLYVMVKTFGRSKKALIRLKELCDLKSCYYNFGDGWGASVSIKAVDSAEARKLRKASNGFCGYEWMVSSIIRCNVIYADEDKIKAQIAENDGLPFEPSKKASPELVPS